jgi:hypothetical protein
MRDKAVFVEALPSSDKHILNRLSVLNKRDCSALGTLHAGVIRTLRIH